MSADVKVGDLGSAPVVPLMLILSGGYLMWFGVHYWRSDVKWPSDPVKDVLQGKSLPIRGSVTTSADILTQVQGATPFITVTGGGSASGQAIANDAVQYQGAGYVWGGAPAQGIGHWDCSSFANWVIGHDLHASIPGYPDGSYTGAVHGPSTIEWLSWSGCTTIGHEGKVAQPGDLCVWQTHMGIAIGGGEMISAQTPSSGTKDSGIDGFIEGETLFVRRLNAAVSIPSGGGKKK